MDRPETEPAYIERCLDAFLDAMREADAMAHAGKAGPELVEVLRFAADLVDIIAEGLQSHSSAEAPLGLAMSEFGHKLSFDDCELAEVTASPNPPSRVSRDSRRAADSW